MKKHTREIRVEGEIAFVPLTQGYEAVIDADCVPLISKWNWHVMLTTRPDGSVAHAYAARGEHRGARRRIIHMHRVIADTPSDMDTDHIDGDGLNNRRSNLRVVTHAQNQCNRRLNIDNKSGVRGVAFNRATGKWRAQIGVNGAKRYLGLFSSIDKAAQAYASASAELHGEFGRIGE